MTTTTSDGAAGSGPPTKPIAILQSLWRLVATIVRPRR